MAIEETINRMLDLEKRSLQNIKNGEIDGVNEHSLMRMTSAIQWKIDLLNELKAEIQ